LNDCSLAKAGYCTWIAPIGFDACPYGRPRKETGFTKRARKFSSWISEKKKQHEGVPRLEIPPHKLAFIGDYVYLPYTFIAMNKSVPFLGHDAFIISGCRFLPHSAWTIENVLSIINFRPQAMMGGTIKQYQREVVPKFIEHVRECDSNMWEKLIKEKPELDKEPNYVGRKALLRTLPGGISFTPTKTTDKYPVTWQWDGDNLTTNSLHAYNSTWGDMKLKSVAIDGIPEDDATIVVESNEWVTKDTQFVD
jgi:hypothetical protein